MVMVAMVSKVKSESGKAKGGEGPAMASSRDAEHMSPPSLHLGHEHMKALGLHKGPIPYKVGDKIPLSALVHVGAISEDQDHAGHLDGKPPSGEGSTRRSMTLHFHKMDMGDGNNSGTREESQKDGMKSEIDKALTQHAGSEAEKGKAKGKTPTPRGGGD